MRKIEIIDLFAGPGGLGEGFSSYKDKEKHPFKISISIEKDYYAHQTLSLRSFCRKFKTLPKEYYQYAKGIIDRKTLFELYPEQAKEAEKESWLAELGGDDFAHKNVVSRIKSQLGENKDDCIIIGGPPCQAYSLVGRSKMAKNKDFANDPRHTLYKEYLKIIADFKPSIFVMENVKGILSSKLDGELVFDKILRDLQNPKNALDTKKVKVKTNEQYTIYSLVSEKPLEELKKPEFIIKSEDYGIPQARHRVILLGVRNDIKTKPRTLKKHPNRISTEDVIGSLPKLRSGLSKLPDTYDNWKNEIIKYNPSAITYKNLGRGGNFVESKSESEVYKDWYSDPNLDGVLNHETKAHISADLHRYHYISSCAHKSGISPKLEHLPKELLPNHKNVGRAIENKSLFNDRFRVQVANRPATTITSHISKDGHYFIHYDSKQCRSLTVREAARIQTFPDNYKFEGTRTSQYHQVGNAVPPLLAKQIAEIVCDLIKRNSSNS